MLSFYIIVSTLLLGFTGASWSQVSYLNVFIKLTLLLTCFIGMCIIIHNFNLSWEV